MMYKISLLTGKRCLQASLRRVNVLTVSVGTSAVFFQSRLSALSDYCGRSGPGALRSIDDVDRWPIGGVVSDL